MNGLCRFCEDGLHESCLDGQPGPSEKGGYAIECECETMDHKERCECCDHPMSICWCEARGCNP